MRILVTGATGLIGSHATVQLLAAGHPVRAFVREPDKLDRVLAPLRQGRGPDAAGLELAIGDLADAGSIGKALEGCQGLLHCAGVFSPDVEAAARLEEINVEGCRRVLEAGVAASLERIVHVSSILALFPPAGAVMTADDAVTRPRSMYAGTKARAERIARLLQADAPLTIVYPAAVQGPHDPTFSIGPQLVADALEDGKALVTSGGLAYTDARDLAALIVEIFAGATTSTRLMAPSFYVTHERYHGLLESLTGRMLEAQRVPGWLLRAMGRIGDVAQRLGRNPQLTYEAAEVLTRSVPVDDREARRLLGRDPISDEQSFRDLIRWMVEAGHLDGALAGSLAEPDVGTR